MTRRRRILLLVAAAAAAGAAAFPALRSLAAGLVADHARREITARAAAGLHAPIGIGRIDVSFHPAALVLHDLRLDSDGAFGLRAGSSLERLELRGAPAALLDWGSRPVEMLVERPECIVALPGAASFSTGIPAAPASASRAGAVAGAPPGGVAFPPGSTLAVRNGRIRAEAPGGVAFDCAGFGFDTTTAAPPALIAGRVLCARGLLTTPLGDLPDIGGQAGFEWGPGILKLDPLILHGQGLDLAGRGTLQGSDADPRVEARATIGLDLARAAPFLPAEAAPAGRVDVTLEGGFLGGVAHGQGTFNAPSMRLFGLEVADARATLDLGETLRATDLKAGLLGGEIGGTLEVNRRGGGWEAGAEITATGLDAARLLALASWSGPPIDGRIDYTGRHTLGGAGLASLRGGGDLAIAGGFRDARGARRTFEARLGVTTTGTTVDLEDGTIRTGAVEGRFEGRLSREQGLRLKLRGAAGTLADLLPLFRMATPRPPAKRSVSPTGTAPAEPAAAPAAVPGAAPGAAPLRPVRLIAWDPAAADSDPFQVLSEALGGRWQWDGDFGYDKEGVRFEGWVSGDDLTWHGTPLGSLTAEVTYSGERLIIRQLLVRAAGGGAAAASGGIDFHPPGRLSLTGDIQSLPLPLVLALAGIDLDIDGQADGHVEIGGTLEAPVGQATIETGLLVSHGLVFDGLRGGLELQDGMILARDLVLRRGDGELSVDGALALDGTLALDGSRPGDGAAGTTGVTIRAHGLDLKAIAPDTGRFDLAGVVEADGRLEGRWRAPTGHIGLRAAAVRVAGVDSGDISIDADLKEGEASIAAAAPARALTLAGRIGLAAGLPVDLTLEATDLALKGSEMMTGVPEDVSVTLAGRAAITGPAARPRELTARVTVDRVQVAVAGASASAESAVEAELRDGRLTMRPTVLTGTGTRIDLQAGVDLDPDGRVDLEARGQFDLALTRTFVRGLQAEGEGDIQLDVSGPRRDPSFKGSLHMQAPRVRYPDLPFPIDDLAADVVFDGIGARIVTLQFMAGGGRVDAGGEILLGTSGVSHGLASILAADIALKGGGVGAEFPAGFRSMSNLDLRLVYDPTGATLSGTIDLVRGLYSRNFRIESSILTGKPPALFDLHPPGGPLAALRLDLALRAPGQIWVRNDLGRIEGQVDLRVTGTTERPSVAGRITALEGSTIDFNRVRYRLLTGTIDFNDPEIINPFFNLNAETSVGEYQVGLLVEGTLDRFTYQLTSNPPLSQADVVSLLLTGHPIGGLGTSSTALSPESVSAYLAGQLSQQLGSHLLGKVAPDVIAIDPHAVSTDPLETIATSDPTTRITVAKQITPDLRVTYTDFLGASQGAAYQLDYRVGRNISFASERSGTGSIGGDFRYVLEGRMPIPPGGPPLAAVSVKPVIASVRIQGDPILPPERVVDRLRLDAGKPRDQARLVERLDKLLGLYQRKGYLTAELEVKEEPAGDGRIHLAVIVRAGPKVRLDIEGVSGAGALRDQIAPLWQQAIFLEDTVEEARERLIELVVDRGWRRASATAEVLQNDAGLVHIRFEVARGPRARVAEVRVEGTRQISVEEARGSLKTRPDSAFTRGIVRGDRLRDDAATLQALYVSRGFPKAEADPAQVDLDADGKKAVVTFPVHEGPRVSVRHALFHGARGLPEERLSGAADLQEGVPFTREGMEAAAARIRRTYDESGWPDARVRWRAERAGGDDVTEKDAESEEDDIIFTVDEGARQEIADVTIAGNAITNDRAIRRRLTITPHEPLSRADLLTSQTRLYRLGVFRSVDIRPVPLAPPAAGTPVVSMAAAGMAAGAAPEGVATGGAAAAIAESSSPNGSTAEWPAPAAPTPPPGEAVPTPSAPAAPVPAAPIPPAPAPAVPSPEPLERPVNVVVGEAPPLRQVFGVGYDSIEKIRGLYEIAYRNLFGSARYLGLQMRASSVDQRASILYREQGVFTGRYDLLGSAFGIDEQRPAFTGRTVGVATELSRELGRSTRLRYRYALKDVNLSEATSDFTGSTVRLASLAASAVHDTRDAPFGPLRGHYYAADIQGYGHAIGSEAQFAKIFAQAFTFKEVLPRTVWAQAVRVGAAITFGQTKSDPTSTGDTESGVPQSERFYAGGDTTMRGFGRDLVGQLDGDGKPFGGEGLFLINEELRFPIWNKLQGVVFADVGNVYRTLSDYTLRDLRECAGAGLRLMTPIGPFRMEYGWILDLQPGEDPGQFFISIGQAF